MRRIVKTEEVPRERKSIHVIFTFSPHRLSGYDPDEEEDEFDELQEKAAHPEQLVRRKEQWHHFTTERPFPP